MPDYEYKPLPTRTTWVDLCFWLLCIICLLAIAGHLVEEDERDSIADQCYLSQPFNQQDNTEWINNCIKTHLKEHRNGSSR